ncbi:MAG: YceI family protein [Ignavibacteria bacterium]|nr:YceI family protein [Ignavibacteria bacterium]
MRTFCIIFGFCLFVLVSYSQTLVINSVSGKSVISYELRHPAHDVVGISRDLQIKIEYDKNKNQILNAIAQVKVTTFNSGNSNRDSHAMELIEAIKYPFAKFRSTKIVDYGDSLTIYGDLTFHNVTKNITIKAKKVINQNKIFIKGNFAISLDQFNVERPKLLFVPSEEYLRFEFSCEFIIN